MREIKFRAWVKHKKKMMYKDTYICLTLTGKLIDGCAKLPEETETPFYNPMYGEELNKDNHILMQYTGLKDKNGKEIYEGDIIGWPHDDGINKPVMCQYVVEWKVRDHPLEWETTSGFGITNEAELDKLVILGNIYEHRDLLK